MGFFAYVHSALLRVKLRGDFLDGYWWVFPTKKNKGVLFGHRGGKRQRARLPISELSPEVGVPQLKSQNHDLDSNQSSYMPFSRS